MRILLYKLAPSAQLGDGYGNEARFVYRLRLRGPSMAAVTLALTDTPINRGRLGFVTVALTVFEIPKKQVNLLRSQS